MRIAKFISNAGLCSRRDAEKLIEQKKVFINNICCKHPSYKVSNKDKVIVNKKIITVDNIIRLWKMYKPIKILCTNKDPNKRRTVFDLMPKNFPRVISIGRLDYMSEGLLLFTNNGDFARKLELPSSNFLRKYRLCLKNKIDNKDIRIINKGVTISGINYNKIKIKVEKKNDKYTWLIINLFEGKNREIRNICKHFKWQIIKLIRIQYASISLEKQKPGQIIEVKNFSSIL